MMIGVAMAGSYDLIKDRVSPGFIRNIAELDDDAIKISVAYMICEIIGGIKILPTKRHKTELARQLINIGVSKIRVMALCDISKTQYYRLRGENER